MISSMVVGLVITACSSSLRKTRPRLREVRRLNLNVNSSFIIQGSLSFKKVCLVLWVHYTEDHPYQYDDQRAQQALYSND